MATDPGDVIESKVKIVQENMFDSGLVGLELELVRRLQSEASTIDELCRVTGKNVGEVSVAISTLTMKGLTEEEAGKIYLLKM